MAEQKPWPPQPSMDHSLLGAALAQVRDTDAWWADKTCLIFMAFTCVRSNEAREADLGRGQHGCRHMTIPGSRRKNRSSHRVPLSTQAKQLLAHARAQTDPNEKPGSFPLKAGRVHSTRTLSILMRRLDTHGASGFRPAPNWAGEAAAHPGTRDLDGPGPVTTPRPLGNAQANGLLPRAPACDASMGTTHQDHGPRWSSKSLM